MFAKGNPGRPTGSKNDPKIMAIKGLLEDAFLRNRSAALAKIDAMFQDKTSNEDFKFLLKLKTEFEPKPKQAIEHSGSIEGTQINIVTLSNSKDDKSGLPDNSTPRVGLKIPDGQLK